MTTDINNLFESLPVDISAEVFTHIVQSENIHIERIVSNGHTSPATGWHNQTKHEWVIVLKGEAKLLIEDEPEVHLVAGSHLNIPAHTKHKVTWTQPNTQTIWLAVHYAT